MKSVSITTSKRFLSILSILLLSFSFTFAQEPCAESSWTIQGGGVNRDDVNAIVTDNEGNSYITGMYAFSATYGDIEVESNPPIHSCFVAKISPEGEYLWVSTVTGTTVIGYDIALDPDNNVIIGGYFNSVLHIGDTILEQTATGQYQLFLAKFDNDGNFEWVKVPTGGIGSSYIKGVGCDAEGNVYTTGTYTNTIVLDSLTVSRSGQTSDEGSFIFKIDSEGEEIWMRKISSGANNSVRSMTVDGDGNSYVTGRFVNSIQIDTIEFHYQSYYGENPRRTFVYKLNSEGSAIWGRISDELNQATEVSSISRNEAGDIFVTGRFTGDISFNGHTLTSTGSGDAFVIKLNEGGDIYWMKGYGGPKDESPRDIAADDFGNFYLVGYFKDSTVFGDTTLYAKGPWEFEYGDGFIAKMNPEGENVWASRIGGKLIDEVTAVAADPFGNVIMAGIFRDSSEFIDTNFFANWLGAPHAKHRDIFISKIIEFSLHETEFTYEINEAQVDFEASIVGETEISENHQFNWDFGNGFIGQGQNVSHTYMHPGTYTILLESIEDINDVCSVPSYMTEEIIVEFESTVSVEKEHKMNEVLIYPNPAKDVLHISADINIQDYIITDVRGVINNQGVINSYTSEIAIANLSPGIYFIQLRTEQGENIKRFIKE